LGFWQRKKSIHNLKKNHTDGTGFCGGGLLADFHF
jgi:hypothetical protein